MRVGLAGFRPPRRTRAVLGFSAECQGGLDVGGARALLGFSAECQGGLATEAKLGFAAECQGGLETRAVLGFSAECSGYLEVDAVDPTYPNGFENFIEFLIPAESVLGSGTLNNCLLCIDDTFADLRTVANGGYVQHASGYDMRLELADGTVVPFARLAWSATTGRIVLRARRATLPQTDTLMRLYFGKSVTTDGASPGGAYASHLAAPDIVTGGDRTGLSRTWTPTGLAAGTLAGYSATFNGSTSQLVRANPTELNGLSSITVQAIVQLSSVAADQPIFLAGPATGSSFGIYLRFQASTGRLIATLAVGASSTTVESPDDVMPAVGTAMLVAMTWTSGQAPKLFVGGEIVTLAVAGTALTGTTNATLGAASSEALIGFNRSASLRFAGQIADLMVSARVIFEGHLQTQERNYLTPRYSYGVGERNSADTVNTSPIVPPIFAAATVGSDAEVDPALEAYEADAGQVKTLESHTGAAGGTFSMVGGRARFRPSAAGTWPSTATVKDSAVPAKRSAGAIIWVASGLAGSARPKIPPTVAAARQWWIGGGGPGGSQSPATLATALAAAADGDHIYLPAGNTALGTLSALRSATNPLVIRGRPMAAGSKAPTSIITGKTVLSGRGYWLYELQTSYAGSDRHNADIHITGSYMTVTRCWLTGREGMQIVNPAHHCNIGWNRFTGRNTRTGTAPDGGPAAPNCFQFEISVPGSFPTPTSGPYNIACYRNFFWDDTNHGLYDSSYGGESMCCYVGNDHPGPDDLGTLLNVVFEENFYAKAGGRKRSLYSKRGCDMIRNRSVHTGSIFGQRHGWGSKIYGNRVTDTDFIVIGDERAGSYAAGNDLRNNVAGGTIRLGRAYNLNSPDGSPYQAADWTTMFKNNGKVTVGFIASNGVPTTDMGGILSNVRIYAHVAGAITKIRDNYDESTYTEDPGNPLGLTNGAELISATFADADVGFEVASQGL